jgi:GNAT superfamily N-acetyltransferase
MNIRALQREDKEPIRQILITTDVFTDGEIKVALELIEICLDDPHQQDYEIFCCINEHQCLAGYICVGPTPGTDGTFDLYWIAVAPAEQGKGVATALLEFVEQHLRSKGGRMLIAETSSTPKYEKTQAFYLNKGFAQSARVYEYYRPGDDLIIYSKHL